MQRKRGSTALSVDATGQSTTFNLSTIPQERCGGTCRSRAATNEQNNQSIGNENNTFGRPGATGVARPETKELTRRTQTKDGVANFTELRIVSSKLWLTT